MDLQARAEALADRVFLGGPLELFERAGRLQLACALRQGLRPGDRLLDVGCGCLRGGYWLIHFLDPDRYFGIEPDRRMLEAGLDHILEPGLAVAKRPRFDGNARFDFSVFGERFDFVLARSVWTHASRAQIRAMLDGFLAHTSERAVFLTSYRPAGWLRFAYRGDRWVGRSHESDRPGMIRHRFGWVRRACRSRGLEVVALRERADDFGGQTWLRIERSARTPGRAGG